MSQVRNLGLVHDFQDPKKLVQNGEKAPVADGGEEAGHCGVCRKPLVPGLYPAVYIMSMNKFYGVRSTPSRVKSIIFSLVLKILSTGE